MGIRLAQLKAKTDNPGDVEVEVCHTMHQHVLTVLHLILRIGEFAFNA